MVVRTMLVLCYRLVLYSCEQYERSICIQPCRPFLHILFWGILIAANNCFEVAIKRADCGPFRIIHVLRIYIPVFVSKGIQRIDNKYLNILIGL